MMRRGVRAQGHAGVLRELVSRGADVDALAVSSVPQATSRTSALWAAVRGKHQEAAEVLRAAGATEQAHVDPGPPPGPAA